MKRKKVSVRAGLVALVLMGVTSFAFADLSSFRAEAVASQRAHLAALTARNSPGESYLVPDGVDVFAATKEMAQSCLPEGLSFVPESYSLAMDDAIAKAGSMCFSGPGGTSHLFMSWVVKKMQKPLCWAGEGYPVQAAAGEGAFREFLGETVLSAPQGAGYTVKGVASLLDPECEVCGEFSGKQYSIPYDAAFLAFVDDDPLANWGHPARLVFVKGDLSAFVVWYVSEPICVKSGGKDVPLADFGGTVEVPREPTLEEVRNAVGRFNAMTLDGDAENIVLSGGRASNSYAVLISGGYNVANNHTRYWGDVAAVYSTLTQKYGIPKGNIKVCMSDGTSSAADISTDSSSHGLFPGNSSPLDLDGDGNADVGYSATRSSIRSAFASLSSLTKNDQLFVFVTDHGSQDYFGECWLCLWGEDMMSVSDFAALTAKFDCPVAFAFEFCYSGAFIDALRRQGGTRVVATAAGVTTSSAWSSTSRRTGIGWNPGLFFMDPWVYYFVAAIRGSFPYVGVRPWDDYSTCNEPDTSGDGRVSMREASDYAYRNIRADGYREYPDYGESSVGAGDYFFAVKGLPPRGAVRPENDNFADATPISGLSGSAIGSTVGATPQAGEPLVAFSSVATNTVWWSWTAPANGSVTFSTAGSAVDTVMGVYRGASLAGLSVVRQDDDGGPNKTGACMFDAVAGTTYHIAVSGKGNANQGVVVLEWNMAVQSNYHTIVLYRNDGQGATFKSYTIPSGSWTLPTAAELSWSRPGLVLLGWSESSRATEPTYLDGQEISVESRMTLYAVWGDRPLTTTFTVKLLRNDNTGLSRSYSMAEGSWVIPTADSLLWLREGHDFLGWSTSKSAKAATYQDGAEIYVSESVTLYAVWQQKTLSMSFGSALDNMELVFTTGGSSPWYGQSEYAHDGEDAARSRVLGGNQESWIETVVSGKGTVSFWWLVSSEARWDHLDFMVDGEVMESISGTSGTWTRRLFDIATPGVHALRWRYSKDKSGSAGLDAGFLDQVAWIAAIPPPVRELVLDRNDGTGVMRSYEQEEGDWTLPTAASLKWSRTGYDFMGWSESDSAATATYSDGQTIAVSGDVVLYAVWKKKSVVIALPAAVDSESLEFTTAGSSQWYGQTERSHDGTGAARSGILGNNQTNRLETTVSGQGTISFWWFVSSEPVHDVLEFLIDGVVMAAMSGTDNSWEYKSFEISKSGSHVLQWRYRKDGSDAYGFDAAFVDQISWNEAAPLPVYRVTLNKNDGSGATWSYEQPAGVGVIPTQASLKWSRFGYDFLGWSKSRNATVADYKDGGEFLFSGHITLYAVWSERPPVVSIPDAVDNDSLLFTVGGATPWYGQTERSYDGVDAVRSGAISGGQTNWLQTVVSGPGEVSFWWYADSEKDFDLLEFLVDGVVVDSTSGTGNSWERRAFQVSGSGSHVLQWRYGKDDSQDSGMDSGFVDAIEWSSATPVPATYKVAYRPGAYGTGSPLVETKIHDVALVLKGAIFTRQGYTQTGWATEDGGAKAYGLNATYKANASVVLYPFWRQDWDETTIQVDTADEYETNGDGTFQLALNDCVRSASTPKLSVKGLPSGLKFDSKTGVISGSATKPGSYSVTVNATNATVKKPVTKTFMIVVPNLACAAMPGLRSEADAYGVVMCGVAFDQELVDCKPELGWTVKAAGLPAGLKLADKTLVDGKTGEILAVAGSIYGVPTKAGTFTVTFTATRGKEKQVATITLKVEALPDFATGSFSGCVWCEDDFGSATMTVAANGKASGKVALLGTNWTFSAASYAWSDDSVYVVEAVAKAGKATMPVSFEVREAGSPDGHLANAVAAGMVGDCDAMLWRGMWKDKATAAVAKAALAKWEGLYTLSLEDGGYMSLTVGKDGTVKASGKLADGTGVSASSPLVYDEYDGWLAYFYTAPSAYKGGSFAIVVGFDGPHGPLSQVITDGAQWTSRNPQATAEYGEGFCRALGFVGAYYGKKPDVSVWTQAEFDAESPESYSFDGVPPKVSVAQATGIFKGSCSFLPCCGGKAKKANFAGIVVLGEESLRGFYPWDAASYYFDPKTAKEKAYKLKEPHIVTLTLTYYR